MMGSNTLPFQVVIHFPYVVYYPNAPPQISNTHIVLTLVFFWRAHGSVGFTLPRAMRLSRIALGSAACTEAEGRCVASSARCLAARAQRKQHPPHLPKNETQNSAQPPPIITCQHCHGRQHSFCAVLHLSARVHVIMAARVIHPADCFFNAAAAMLVNGHDK